MADEPTTNSVETALASLKPIRDLAKNWDIDIASCLEEYLQDLVGGLSEEERRNLPKQAEALNFSQAALVLQNSSSVYSRKVEYLYNLVIQVHEDLISSSGDKSSASGNGNPRKSSVDGDIEQFDAFDPNLQFLLLDDVLPTDENGSTINLRDDKDEHIQRNHALSFASATTSTRVSMGATFTTGSHLDRSASSAAQSATHHVVCRSMDTGSLRLIDGRCDVGDDGILILPGAGRMLDEKLRSSVFGSSFPSNKNANNLVDPSQHEQGSNSFMMNEGDYDDGDNAGDAFTFPEDHGVCQNDLNAPEENTEPNYQHQSTRRQVTLSEAAENCSEEPLKEDPWKRLDPHVQALSSKARPLRLGKTVKLPPGVAVLPSNTVSGAAPKKPRRAYAAIQNLFQKPTLSPQLSLAMKRFRATLSAQQQRNRAPSGATNKGNQPPPLEVLGCLDMQALSLKGLNYGNELLYIDQMTTRMGNAKGHEDAKQSEPSPGQLCEQENEYVYSEEDDGCGAMDWDGGSDNGSAGGGCGFEFARDDDTIGNADIDDIFKRKDNHAKTFEELCRAHIQAFAKGAEAYAAETRLSKRVGNWHQRLVPILEEEENRPEFDIHAYTKRVVNAIEEESERLHETSESKGLCKTLSSKNRIVGFDAVTQSCAHFEVCRLFLASLSLSNSGNVLLKHNDGEYDSKRLHIELISSEIERPMENYLAPSVVEKS